MKTHTKIFSDSEQLAFANISNDCFHYFNTDCTSHKSKHWTWITLWDTDKDIIIGLVKMGISYNNKPNESLSIWYFEIHNEYQGLGLSRLLCDAMCKYIKNKGLMLYTSYYTEIGKLKIYKLFNEYCEKYKIRFFDRDGKYESDYIEKKYDLMTTFS